MQRVRIVEIRQPKKTKRKKRKYRNSTNNKGGSKRHNGENSGDETAKVRKRETSSSKRDPGKRSMIKSNLVYVDESLISKKKKKLKKKKKKTLKAETKTPLIA